MPGNPVSDPGFQATRWSLVAALDPDQDTLEQHAAPARQRLLELCLRYWYPVYLYLRRSGHSAEAAQVLAANFFDALLQRRGSGASRGHDGRFRTFLLVELHRFLAEGAMAARDGSTIAPLDPDLPTPPVAQLEARRQREGDAGGSPELALRRGFAEARRFFAPLGNRCRVLWIDGPGVQAQILAKCETKLRHSYYEIRQEVARYARLKLDGAMPMIVCKRVMKGYLNGRMKWSDYEAIMESGRQRVTPNKTRLVRSG